MEDVIELFISCVIDFVFGVIVIMMLIEWLNKVCGGAIYV